MDERCPICKGVDIDHARRHAKRRCRNCQYADYYRHFSTELQDEFAVYQEEFHGRLKAFVEDLGKICHKHRLAIEMNDHIIIDEFCVEELEFVKDSLLKFKPSWYYWRDALERSK